MIMIVQLQEVLRTLGLKKKNYKVLILIIEIRTLIIKNWKTIIILQGEKVLENRVP